MDYISEYRSKDDQQLERSLRALSGQPDDKAKQRMSAIRQVIAERSGHAEVIKTDEPKPEPQSFDMVVAKKFIAKAENAKKRGIEFSLTLGHMKSLMSRKTCYYTGIRLEDDCDPMEPQKRTLDRIDPAKGYTNENTIACSLAANSLKNVLFEDPVSMCRMNKKEFRCFVKKILS